MENREDLEQLLLNGLPADEREQTLAALARTTAEKLARLQSTVQREPADDSCKLSPDDDEGDVEEAQPAGTPA